MYQIVRIINGLIALASIFFSCQGNSGKLLIKNEQQRIQAEKIRKILESEILPAKEHPFVLRKFEPYLEGKWIGNAVAYGCYRKGQEPGGRGPDKNEILKISIFSLLSLASATIITSSNFTV